jgi:hypothetical protein
VEEGIVDIAIDSPVVIVEFAAGRLVLAVRWMGLEPV